MTSDTVSPAAIQAAQAELDAHVRRIVQWHFSPETGCPFWLEWARKAGWDPAATVKGFSDLLRFPHFQDEWLRDLQPEVWVPKAYAGRPFNIFETGGTTGMLAHSHLRLRSGINRALDTRTGHHASMRRSGGSDNHRHVRPGMRPPDADRR